jgi:2-methylcitrate dehydratase PrpD
MRVDDPMSSAYPEAILSLRWGELPPQVQLQARRCLKDLLAVAAASRSLPASSRWQSLVEEQYGPGPAPLWFTSRSSSLCGAALFNAATVDSLDWHDGYRPVKGHAGATVIPVLLASCAAHPVSGAELLTSLVVGYEVACRAGLALHHLYRPAYHASGAWAAVGAAAAGARVLEVSPRRIDGLLGAAEYYAPISPMMRVIDNPASVKDSAAAGAWAAATALSMEACGLGGPPSLLAVGAAGGPQAGPAPAAPGSSVASGPASAEPAARAQAPTLPAPLGREWLILRQYFKPYPTCRWSQPAVEGALQLKRAHGFSSGQLERIDIETFAAGARLVRFPPRHSDDAQYSTPWAVAAALADGELGLRQVHPDRLGDPEILRAGRKVFVSAAQDLEARFPEECLARVTVSLLDGRTFSCPAIAARGDWNAPLSPAELQDKFTSALEPVVGRRRCDRLEALIGSLEKAGSEELLALL